MITSRNLNIVVVGAGIGGLAFALSAHRLGFDQSKTGPIVAADR
jgi:glycine/D-amino acid oxidase-like deaminating enzyme